MQRNSDSRNNHNLLLLQPLKTHLAFSDFLSGVASQPVPNLRNNSIRRSAFMMCNWGKPSISFGDNIMFLVEFENGPGGFGRVGVVFYLGL